LLENDISDTMKSLLHCYIAFYTLVIAQIFDRVIKYFNIRMYWTFKQHYKRFGEKLTVLGNGAPFHISIAEHLPYMPATAIAR